jgi:hypothetical protein
LNPPIDAVVLRSFILGGDNEKPTGIPTKRGIKLTHPTIG